MKAPKGHACAGWIIGKTSAWLGGEWSRLKEVASTWASMSSTWTGSRPSMTSRRGHGEVSSSRSRAAKASFDAIHVRQTSRACCVFVLLCLVWVFGWLWFWVLLLLWLVVLFLFVLVVFVWCVVCFC